jgi:HEAT repeat protein
MSPRSRRRQRKPIVRGHLERRELEALRAWARREQANVISTLVAFLLELDDLVRWRAVEALAVVAADQAQEDLERVRDLIRRQFWSMMEESGNMAWHAPEAIGEILRRVPELALEYTSQLAAYDEFPFSPGIAWALARLAPVQPQLVREELEFLQRNLGHEDPLVRGNAALALGRLGQADAAEAVEALVDDDAPVIRYDFAGGGLINTSVGALAREALAGLKP